MQEDMLKTSWKERIFVIIIAAILLGSGSMVYISALWGGNSSAGSSEDGVDQELISKLSDEYDKKSNEVNEEASKYSDKYFKEFVSYKSRVKAYNSMTINNNGLSYEDLKKGSGEKITEDSKYFMYYIGWCANEEVFDSSFNDVENPTSLKTPLSNQSIIQGLIDGLVGMRYEGVREVSIPNELAYGDSREICGGTDQSLKFVVMAIERKEPLATLADELSLIEQKLQYAYYGLDYDKVFSGSTEE